MAIVRSLNKSLEGKGAQTLRSRGVLVALGRGVLGGGAAPLRRRRKGCCSVMAAEEIEASAPKSLDTHAVCEF